MAFTTLEDIIPITLIESIEKQTTGFVLEKGRCIIKVRLFDTWGDRYLVGPCNDDNFVIVSPFSEFGKDFTIREADFAIKTIQHKTIDKIFFETAQSFYEAYDV